MRRVIEAVCQDRAATGRTFYDKLRSLAENRDIPSKLLDIAHGIRKLSNVGAHFDEDVNLTQDEAELLNDLCIALLEYVYTAPKLLEKVQGSLERIEK